MQATLIATLADHVRNLPAEGAARDRRLHRLTDLVASTEAIAALQAATVRMPEGADLKTALASAADLLDAGLGDPRRDEDPALGDRLRAAIVAPEFLSFLPGWVRALRELASEQPDSGACTLASALELWSWTMDHFRTGEGARAESASRAADVLAETLAPLLAARCFVMDLEATPAARTQLRADLSQVYASRAAAQTGAACAELVFGYRRHLVWDAEGCASCFSGDELDDLEAMIPGIASGARMSSDVVEADGSHPSKRGPCAHFEGVEAFTRLRSRLDGCLTGAGIARDRAAAALARSFASTSTTPEGKA
jgi:hypothetical protein